MIRIPDENMRAAGVGYIEPRASLPMTPKTPVPPPPPAPKPKPPMMPPMPEDR